MSCQYKGVKLQFKLRFDAFNSTRLSNDFISSITTRCSGNEPTLFPRLGIEPNDCTPVKKKRNEMRSRHVETISYKWLLPHALSWKALSTG